MTTTAIAAGRIDRQSHRQQREASSSAIGGRTCDAADDAAGGRAVLNEEVLEVPEPLARLECPVGLEVPVDETRAGLRQRLLRDGRADKGGGDVAR